MSCLFLDGSWSAPFRGGDIRKEREASAGTCRRIIYGVLTALLCDCFLQADSCAKFLRVDQLAASNMSKSSPAGAEATGMPRAAGADAADSTRGGRDGGKDELDGTVAMEGDTDSDSFAEDTQKSVRSEEPLFAVPGYHRLWSSCGLGCCARPKRYLCLALTLLGSCTLSCACRMV